MKLCLLVMVTFTFSLSAIARAQQEKVNLNLNNVTVKMLFEEIQKQTNLSFIYNIEQMGPLGKVSVYAKEESVEDVLRKVLDNTGLMFEFDGNLIIVRPRVPQEKIVEYRLSGKVTDKRKEPLPGVTVLIKGTTIGCVTDVEGKYQLVLPRQDNLTLVFSFIGMKTKEVKVNGQEKIDIVMEEDAAELEEVVITGYGNIKKNSFTGNATSVDREQLLRANNKNIINALQTFDPSFRIRENSNWGSDPNALPEFNIRGESSIGINKGLDIEQMKQEQHTDLKDNPNLPVFIMDGFEVDVQKVYDMDMNRVQNITILKDAAATALYGSRAANGVIVITTVAPRPGQLRVSYNGTFSVELPDLSDYNLCNAAEKLEVERLAGVYTSDIPTVQNRMDLEYNEKLQLILRGANTDWMAQPLRNAFNHKHSVYIDGGVESIRYGLDMNYDSNRGVMKGSYRDRKGIGLTLDYIHKKLRVRNQVSYRSTTSEDSPYGVFSDYASMQPYYRIHDDKGEMIEKYTIWGANDINPMYKTLLGNYSGRYVYNELMENFNLQWEIVQGLQFKGQFSITKTDNKTSSFKDPRSAEYEGQTIPNNERGELTENMGNGYNWTLNGMFYYNQALGKHFINATAGIEMMESHSKTYGMVYQGFPMGSVQSPVYAAQQKNKTSNQLDESRLVGLLANINYSYNNIYLFDASFRLDGSSQFGADKRFAPFWSFGTGLNIHNYEALKQSDFISLLRVRGSYGSTGKVNFPSYTAVTTYTIDNEAWYYTGAAASLQYLGNTDLKWETTNTLDVGFEIGIRNGLLDLKANYYHKETEDMIDKASIRESSGFRVWYMNAGSVTNEGFEIDLRSTVFRNSDWMVTVIANLAHNTNKITKLGTAAMEYNKELDDNYNIYHDPAWGGVDDMTKYLQTTPFTRYTVGASTTAIYAVRSAGIDPANGKERFIRKNGTSTYTWDSNDQVVVGDKTPKAQGSLGLNISWKGIYMNASFLYQWGGQTYNTTLIDRVENADIMYKNVDKRVLAQRWKKPGDILPYNDINKDRIIKPTSRFVQDYNYLSFSSLAVGYDFPVKMIQKWYLQSLGLRFNATDISRWSSVKEERGISYPYAHNYSLTLNIGF